MTHLPNLYHLTTHPIPFYQNKPLINIPTHARPHPQFPNHTLKKLQLILHYTNVNIPIHHINKILTHPHHHHLSTHLLNNLKVNIQ
ncbi:MerR family transcriptional regulator, partial [Staphylococcus epidermidis]|uniref:MerR family transcriptional regulator n=1 Tax=Staphylococcus epidermidis TaxID=1282 RepID=UPI0021B46623